jgi:hypothetical protein
MRWEMGAVLETQILDFLEKSRICPQRYGNSYTFPDGIIELSDVRE